MHGHVSFQPQTQYQRINQSSLNLPYQKIANLEVVVLYRINIKYFNNFIIRFLRILCRVPEIFMASISHHVLAALQSMSTLKRLHLKFVG